MTEMKPIERIARAMREHWYAYQIGGQLGGDLYVTAKEGGEPLAGPFKTMEEAEFGRDCVIARAALLAIREPTMPMATAGRDATTDVSERGTVSIISLRDAARSFRAMIDKALEE